MNENVLGFIKWAAGIVITLAIISISFIVFNMAKDGTMKGANKIEEMNAQISDSDMTMYDGIEITGSEVVSVIKKFSDSYLGIQVKTGKSPGGTWYGYTVQVDASTAKGIMGDITKTPISGANDETNTLYINPHGSFMGKVYRDANDAVIAITFLQK